ncbi:WGR domain-containing protein [Actinoplanes subglobosus]|uniref:WGR domain-containing protein n=1 Tax=Actinoplanes subglobosus TaxID=1547892 RepID=A0ABV8IS29_9ACTN
MRRFERLDSGAREFWQIRQAGIRCFISWGREGTRRGGATTVTLNDENQARAHYDRKIKAQLRKGFHEVEPLPEPAEDLDALVAPTLRKSVDWPDYRPVLGFDGVLCQAMVFERAPGQGFYHYLILRDEGRSAVGFNVKETSHDAGQVAAFLETVTRLRELPFNGASHHKIALDRPAAAFRHALLCSPALGGLAAAYPTIAPRVATAVPIHDCEIGDMDTEVLVDARISGHGALPYADWARSPKPVIDLRFDIRDGRPGREAAFKVYQQSDLTLVLSRLAGADSRSWVEIRSFHGSVWRVTPSTRVDAAELEHFLSQRPMMR